MKQYIHYGMWCRVYLFCLTLLTVMWTGCSKEDSPFFENTGQQIDKTLAVQIVDAGFNSLKKQVGRAVEDEDFVTTFTEGDQIGVYVVLDGEFLSENVCLTYTNGQWQGMLYDEGENANYFAYYPYDAGLSSDILARSAGEPEAFFAEYIGRFNPSEADNYTKGDLMCGEGSITITGTGAKTIEFVMEHQMSLLVVQLPVMNYFLSTDAEYTWQADVPGIVFSGFFPYKMDDGSYRCLFNREKGWTETCSVSYSGEEGTQTYTFVNDELNKIASGHYVRYIVDKDQTRTVPFTMQVGDFYMSDGSLVSKDAELTEYQKEKCIGIVFWLGDATVDDAALRAEHSGCTHALVVSLNGEERIAWQDDYDYDTSRSGESVGEWIENNEECRERGIISCQTDYEAEDNLHRILGYNNTKGIEPFNEAYPDNRVNPVVTAVEYREKVPAPENSSGWYLPSGKELSLLNSGDIPDIYWDYNTTVSRLIREQFVKLGEDYARDFTNCGWSSSEYSLDFLPTLNGSRAFCVWYIDGEISFDGKANNTLGARYVLAF